MADPKLVLVTGVSGYVGKWCVVKLLEKGYRVRGTVRSEAKAAQVRAYRRQLRGRRGGITARSGRNRPSSPTPDGPRQWAGVDDGHARGDRRFRADEPKDPSVVIRPAVEGTERVLAFGQTGRHQSRHPHVLDCYSRLRPRADNGSPGIRRDLLHQSRKHALDLGLLHRQDQGGARCVGIRQGQRHGTDHHPPRRHHRAGAR